MSDCCVFCNKYLIAGRARYSKVWDVGLRIFLSVRLMGNVERGSLVCDGPCYFQFVKWRKLISGYQDLSQKDDEAMVS